MSDLDDLERRAFDRTLPSSAGSKTNFDVTFRLGRRVEAHIAEAKSASNVVHLSNIAA